MSLTVEREPIDVDQLPPNLQKHAQAGAPEKLQMMAARGMLPVTPEQNVQLLYQLSVVAGGEVASTAEKTFKELPPNILNPVLQKESHAGVLDWAGARRIDDPKLVETIVSNDATDDHTVARIAKRADAGMCDIIATNQVRILNAPVIVEQLYQNPNARMATVDRLLELCKREEVELDGLPGLRDALRSDRDIFGDKETDDDEFAEILRQEAEKAEIDEEEAARLEEMTRAEREEYLRNREEEGDDEEDERRKTWHQKISNMSISEKIRLATLGSREAIGILVRDPIKLVHNAAIRSPRIQYPDVRRWSKNRSLPDSVISYIANNRDWTRHYEVMLNLVGNPKTPLHDVMGFLNHIRTNDLRDIARNRNIPSQVSRQAKNLVSKRTGRGRR